MGNQFSFGRHFFWLGDDEDAGLDFWVGKTHMKRFPACSDELLDLTLAASEMFQLYLRKGVSRRGAKENNTEQGNGVLPSVTFLPFVLTSSSKSVHEISSMNILNRLQFFAENVIVCVFVSDQSPAVLTIQSFLNLHIILIRYLEILKTMKAGSSSSPGQSKHLCSICLDDDSKMVVLSCSHSLCTKCHTKWVSRRLSCPFCRESFQRQSVNQNQWELLEWQPREVNGDILCLEAKLEEAWVAMDFTSNTQDLLVAYEPLQRSIRVQETDGILMVETL